MPPGRGGAVVSRRQAALNTVSDKLVPAQGAWFGASPSTIGGNGITNAGLAAWVNGVGRRPHIIPLWKTGAWSGIFTATELNYFTPTAGGDYAIPAIRWKPNSGGASWAMVAAGQRDADIDNLANNIKNYPRKLFFTVHHEPDNDIDNAAGFSEANFVGMWRRVHDRFAAAGVTNIVWVLNYSGYSSHVGVNGSRMLNMYPGDDYVDWYGWAAYMVPMSRTPWVNFVNENLSNTPGWTGNYNFAMANFSHKPFMLCEWGVGTTPTFTEQDQATALANFLQDITTFTNLRGVQYWHSMGSRDYQVTNKVGVTDLANLVALPWFTQDTSLAP